MKPWGAPAVRRHSCEAIWSRSEKRRNKAIYLTWNSTGLTFVKKISMPKPCQKPWILGYIKYYSLSSPRPVKNPSNPIRNNCQKFCSWSSGPKTILEVRKKPFSQVINKRVIYKFFKDFPKHRKITDRALVFSCRLFPPTFLNTGTTNDTFHQSGKLEDSWRHILRSPASMYKSSSS